MLGYQHSGFSVDAGVLIEGFCRINRPSQGWRYAGGLKFNGWDG
jgi:hypothetical protein